MVTRRRSGLAGAVVAHRDLAHAEDHVYQRDVAPDRPRQGDGRNVIATGVAERGETKLVEAAGGRDQLGGRPGGVVGPQDTHGGRHPCPGERGEGEGRHAGVRAGLTATAREVHMAVYEARDHPAPAEIVLLDPEYGWERRQVQSQPDDLLARDQKVPDTQRLRRVDVRVAQQRITGA
jgi:hypothetical protein